jgi:hypothetical protein
VLDASACLRLLFIETKVSKRGVRDGVGAVEAVGRRFSTEFAIFGASAAALHSIHQRRSRGLQRLARAIELDRRRKLVATDETNTRSAALGA